MSVAVLADLWTLECIKPVCIISTIFLLKFLISRRSTYKARSTGLLILTENISTVYGRKLVLTLRVNGYKNIGVF